MFFRFQRRFNLLRISDSFASLQDILPNGDLAFEFRYTVARSDAFKHEALTVRVTVFTKNVKPLPRLLTQRGLIDTRSLVSNLLTWMPDVKSAANEQANQTIASRVSDITSKVNNNVIDQLVAGVAPANIPQMIRPVLKTLPASVFKSNNEVKPILNFSTVSMTNDTSPTTPPRLLMEDMIQTHGIDPSFVTQVTPPSISPMLNLGGIKQLAKVTIRDFEPTAQLLNHYIFQSDPQQPSTTVGVPDDEMIQVLVNEPVDDVELPVDVVIRQDGLMVDGSDNAQFFVKFELLNATTNLAVDTVTVPLDVSKHIQIFLTPKQPPSVSIGRSETSFQVNLEIKQTDTSAVAVKVFKKGISSSVVIQDEYTLIGTYALTIHNQSLLIPVDMPRNSTAIYRVIAVGSRGTVSFEYTNVVVRPSHFTPVKALALTAHATDTGVQIEARRIPPQVIAVEFLGRNRTTFESNFANIGSDVFVISDEIRSLDYLTIVDRDVSPNNVYEYVANVNYADGRVEKTGNVIIEFLQPTPDKVDTRITNVVVSHLPDPNVTFDVSTEVVDTNSDVIKMLLQRQDIYDLFKDDVAKEREFLKSLIAHNIQRVDLTTGLREDFGVVTVTGFNDNALRNNQAIQPLQIGHKYRYEATALLRAPETLFDNFVKTKTDEVTKKTYSFNPGKFLHPLALSQGILVSPVGLKTRFVKEPMGHGAIGSTQSIEVGLDDDLGVIIDAASYRFNNELVLINWRVQGSIDQFDHFIIMKEANSVRTIIGKSHSEFQYGNCQFFHVLTPHDTGELVYVIAPVLNDYTPGASVQTNSVVI